MHVNIFLTHKWLSQELSDYLTQYLNEVIIPPDFIKYSIAVFLLVIYHHHILSSSSSSSSFLFRIVSFSHSTTVFYPLFHLPPAQSIAISHSSTPLRPTGCPHHVPSTPSSQLLCLPLTPSSGVLLDAYESKCSVLVSLSGVWGNPPSLCRARDLAAHTALALAARLARLIAHTVHDVLDRPVSNVLILQQVWEREREMHCEMIAHCGRAWATTGNCAHEKRSHAVFNAGSTLAVVQTRTLCRSTRIFPSFFRIFFRRLCDGGWEKRRKR